MADTPTPITRRGTYKGSIPLLKGKTADLQTYEITGRCLAQFDDVSTGYGNGWRDFAMDAFDIEPIPGEGLV